MSKRALGKGIEALLKPVENVGSEVKADLSIELSKIETNPDQPRKTFAEEPLKELADSIRENGIIQPLIVEKSGEGFIIIAGERRYRAAKIAGLDKIPVIVREYTKEEKLEIALIENIQREDLNPIEEAKAYKQLIQETALNQEEVAKKVGKKRSTVANSLRLLKMPEDIQESLVKGEVTAGHARAILSVINPAYQRILYARILADGLSVRESEKQAGELNVGLRSTKVKKEKVEKKMDPELHSIEQKLIDVFGTKVSIKGSTKKGKVEISFFSSDDLERIYDIVVK